MKTIQYFTLISTLFLITNGFNLSPVPHKYDRLLLPDNGRQLFSDSSYKSIDSINYTSHAKTKLSMALKKDYAILALVPIIWGSYSPLIKGLYSSAAVIAPPPLIFNLMSYFVSTLALTVANYVRLNYQQKTASATLENSKNNNMVSEVSTNIQQRSLPLPIEQRSKGSSLEWYAGIELGMWLFLGSTVQISGIQSTTAIKASILVQLTTIIVPLLETLLVNKKLITTKLWVSCIVAMIGVITVSTDGEIASSLCTSFSFSCIDKSISSLIQNIKFNTGDLLVSLSAIFYSMHVIRLGNCANRVTPLKLAQMKSITELCLSALAIVAVSLIGGDDMNSFNQFHEYFQVVSRHFLDSGQAYVLLAVLWNGAFATALTTWAQTVGQRSVSPTTANLLYSSQPIWAALFSFSFLNESLSSSTVVGSSLLCFAILYSLYTPTPSTSTS